MARRFITYPGLFFDFPNCSSADVLTLIIENQFRLKMNGLVQAICKGIYLVNNPSRELPDTRALELATTFLNNQNLPNEINVRTQNY